jgi:hypothetical protein
MCENCERLADSDPDGGSWLLRSNGVDRVPGGVSSILRRADDAHNVVGAAPFSFDDVVEAFSAVDDAAS